MDPIRLDAGRLMIESTAASDLAARFGTPLYVTSEAALRANVRAWQSAVRDNWPQGPTRVLVSLKANPTIALRRILNDEGAGCDVFGASELDIALAAGTPAELISVNGSTKPETLIVRAIAAGARLTVDSVEELATAAAAARLLERRAHVRLRLRPDMTDLETTSEFTEHDPLGEVADAYKPGIPIDGCARRWAARPRGRRPGRRPCPPGTPCVGGRAVSPARAASGCAGRRAGTGDAGLGTARDRPRRRLLVSR
jgi:diaminopimelate decarboxylase